MHFIFLSNLVQTFVNKHFSFPRIVFGLKLNCKKTQFLGMRKFTSRRHWRRQFLCQDFCSFIRNLKTLLSFSTIVPFCNCDYYYGTIVENQLSDFEMRIHEQKYWHIKYSMRRFFGQLISAFNTLIIRIRLQICRFHMHFSTAAKLTTIWSIAHIWKEMQED